MKTFCLVVLLCFSAFAASSDVLDLTTDTFDETINNNNFVLVKFHAPWCGHCKTLAPEYVKAAATLKSEGSEVVLAEVDATAQRELGDKYGVKGFPTLKFFRGGKPTDYDGPRKAAGIVSWISKKTGPPCTAISTVEQLEAFKEKADVVVVGAFGDDAEAKAAFEAAAISSEVSYGLLDGTEVIAAAGLTAPGVTVFQSFDEGRADFTGSFDEASISQFVAGNKMPLVIPFSNEKSNDIFGSDIQTHTLVFIDEDDATFADTVKDMAAVSKNFKGQALFVTVASEHDRILGFFGIEKEDMPTVRIVAMGGQIRKFAIPAGPVNEATLGAFVKSYFDGELKPDLKSADIPAEQGNVRVLVGKNFDDEVLNSEKDVLVKFYAPWCGHCKSLAPIWDTVGEKFAGIDSVVIAKFDATANEHAAVEVEGFPTIKFYKAGDKANAIDFEGSRTEDGIIEFLKENAGIPFNLEDAPEPEEGKDEL